MDHHQNSPERPHLRLQASFIPDLNELPPEDLTETDKGLQQGQFQHQSVIIENAKGNRPRTKQKNVLGVKKSSLKPKRTGRYAKLTTEQKKKYSTRISNKHKVKFASWTEEQRNEFRARMRKSRDKHYAKKGPEALKEANRRYQANYRARQKRLKIEQAAAQHSQADRN